MGKKELNFQIKYNMSSAVKYMNYFGKITPIFNNSCGDYVNISVNQNAFKNTLIDVFLKMFQVLNQVWISVDLGKKELNFQIKYNLSSGVKYLNYFGIIRPTFSNSCGNYVKYIYHFGKIRLTELIEKTFIIHNE